MNDLEGGWKGNQRRHGDIGERGFPFPTPGYAFHMQMSAEMDLEPRLNQRILNRLARRATHHVGFAEQRTFGTACAIEGIERRIVRKAEQSLAERLRSFAHIGNPVDDEGLAAQSAFQPPEVLSVKAASSPVSKVPSSGSKILASIMSSQRPGSGSTR